MRVEPAVRLEGHFAVPGDKSISHRALLLGAVSDGETRRPRLRALRRHPVDARGRARARRPGRRRRRRPRRARRRPARPAARVDRLRQRRHARAPDRRTARLPGRQLHAHRRRVALGPPDGARRRAAAANGRPDRDDRRASAAHGHRLAARGDRLRAAGGERPGEVGRPPRRPRGHRQDDRDRAGADPRPHRADAAGRGCARDRPAELGQRRPARAATARRGRRARRLLLGRAVHRRGHAAPRVAHHDSRRRASTRGGRGCSTCSSGWAAGSGSCSDGGSARSRSATSRCAARSSPRRRSIRSEVPLLVDELPLFALLASQARGESWVYGAGELRHKETDRIDAVVDALRAIGARIKGLDEGFSVTGVPDAPERRQGRRARRPPDRHARGCCRAGEPRGRRGAGRRHGGDILPRLLRPPGPDHSPCERSGLVEDNENSPRIRSF